MKCARCKHVLVRGTVAVHTSRGEIMHAACHGRRGGLPRVTTPGVTTPGVTIPSVPKCTPYDLRIHGGGHLTEQRAPEREGAVDEPQSERVFEYDVFMRE